MPSFSIIVPTYRRPAQALKCLGALAGLDSSGLDFEVVLVEDGAGDAPLTERDLAPFRSKVKLVFVSQENAGPAAARNRGAYEASGEYLAFTDDDCMPRPDWLQILAAGLEANPRAILGGHTVNAHKQLACSEASQLFIQFLYEDSAKRGEPFFASNNIAMAKSTFDELGGFDLRFRGAGGEDRELCTTAAHLGLELVHLPDALVDHEHALDLKSFWRQHFNYGRGAFVHHSMAAKREQRGVKVAPLRFYFDLLAYPWRQPRAKRVRFGASLFFLSQVANVAGFFTERRSPSIHAEVTGEVELGGGQVESEEINAPGSETTRRVLRQAGSSGVANVLGLVLTYFVMVGATNALGRERFGDYSLSLAICGLLAIVASLGLSPGLLPFLAKASLDDNPKPLRAVVRSGLLPSLAIGLALFLTVFFLGPWIAADFFTKPQLEEFLVPFSALIFLGSALTVVATVLQGLKAVAEREWIERVLVAGVVALGIGITWQLDLGSSGVIVSVLSGALAGLLAAIWFTNRRQPGVLSPRASADQLRIPEVLGYSWPLLGTSMLAVLLLSTDILCMGYYSDSGSVGLYSAAARVAAIAMIAHQSLVPVFDSALSDLVARDDSKGIARLFRVTARWAMWPGLVLSSVFMIWGRDLLGIFGPEFRPGASILACLCIGKMFAGSCGLTGRVLALTGRARLNLANMIVLWVLNLALNILWIEQYGGLGAAAATTTSLVLIRVAQLVQIRVIYGILPWTKRSLVPLLGIGLLCAIAYPLRTGFGGTWGFVLPLGLFFLGAGGMFLASLQGAEDRLLVDGVRRRLPWRKQSA
ncbi:MAG: O-antigen/teichoic acid export membrane protein/GT2 family glycosyltransferase [Gammaproteobacteria bacterium]